MLFQLTEEQLMIQRAARDFAQECKAGVIERDEKQKFPHEQVLKLAELGFLGMMVKPEYGGAGMDTVSYVLAMEEISKIDASTSGLFDDDGNLWLLESSITGEARARKISKEEMNGLPRPELSVRQTHLMTTAIICIVIAINWLLLKLFMDKKKKIHGPVYLNQKTGA